MKNNPPYIVLFDGVCNFCSGIVQFIIKRDSEAKFKFASLQSNYGQSLLREFNLPTDDFGTFVLIKNNKYFLKSLAGIYVLKELRYFWKLFYVFIVVPRPIRDFVYDFIAKRRHKIFGKKTNCFIPTPEIKQRFLE